MHATALDPRRADVLLHIAQVTEKLGLYGDSAKAYDKYGRLQPDDASARRERGFALASSGELNRGLADLRWYVAKYPRDPDGLFKLGIVEAIEQPDRALEYLNRAIGYKSDWTAARYVRAALYYQQSRIEDARKDLDYVLTQAPDNVRALDLLGQMELRLNEPAGAAEALSRGLRVAPDDPRLLLHYSQALQGLSRDEEARAVAAKFRSLGAEAGHRPVGAWVFDFFNQSPSQQSSTYINGLQAEVTTMPQNLQLRVALARALLAAGRIPDAMAAYREVPKLTSDAEIVAQCGRDLLQAGVYGVAMEFLRSAASLAPSSGRIRLDLAVATFHSTGADSALAELENLPSDQRKGEYVLTKAELQEASATPERGLETLQHALSTNSRARLTNEAAEFYLEASLLFLRRQRYPEALDVLRIGQQANPEDRMLLVAEAFAGSMGAQPSRAKGLLARIQKQWPEWSRVYLIEGVVLEKMCEYPRAMAALKTALTLGTETGPASYYMARALLRASQAHLTGISELAEAALRAEPRNPYCLLFAGVLAFRIGDYQRALMRLQAAASSNPELAEAHTALAEVYRVLGKTDDATRETAERVQRQRTSGGDDGPVPLGALLGVNLRILAADRNARSWSAR
jgi:tetratricopeptide (TPR) repeat protein